MYHALLVDVAQKARVHHTSTRRRLFVKLDYFPVADNPGAIREAPLSISRALRGHSEAVSGDKIRLRPVNKPGCQHEKIGACVPLTTTIGA